ncbi:hypothetical protein PN441_08430 [Spirulina major CS-329]|uniref:hypothetical protein n=1 Tax=Spirulina TaxID=1154 RepID=UPI00232D54CB|nr:MULTISPECIES: hypothetical protein [Spirulina]MDB9494414.1 hypothetical protein [Spirulina subsalsa CS-330]MDB9503098.1 hypothetical protein [Spirulina major CS-329]
MKQRKTLSALVGDEARKPVTTKLTELQTPKPTESQTTHPTPANAQTEALQPQKSVTPELTDSVTLVEPNQQTHKLTNSVSTEASLPKYLQLIRKEARLREDQVDALFMLARRLNRQKKGGERITENTLIRVAIDLLLAHSDQLTGTTEQELQDSITPNPNPTTQ